MQNIQIYDKVQWGATKNGVTTPSKKFTLTTDEYNFRLNFYQGGDTESDRNKFKDIVSVYLTKDMLKAFGRGLLSSFLTKLRSNQYRKPSDEMKPEVFFDGRITVKNGENIYCVRLVGGYKIENNYRKRFSILKVYKFSSWDEITSIRENKKYDESKCIYNFTFDNKSLAEDAFSPEDRADLEIFGEIISAVLIGTNIKYETYLKELNMEKYSNKDNKSENKPAPTGGTVTETTEEVSIDEDEFPF